MCKILFMSCTLFMYRTEKFIPPWNVKCNRILYIFYAVGWAGDKIHGIAVTDLGTIISALTALFGH